MKNDFIKMESKMCPVCGVIHEFNTGILIDKRMKDIKPNMGDKVVTDYGLCERHQKLFDDGYIALIEIDNTHNDPDANTLKFKEANRTGNIAFLKRDRVKDIFTSRVNIPEEQELVFIVTEAFTLIKKMYDQMYDRTQNTNAENIGENND